MEKVIGKGALYHCRSGAVGGPGYYVFAYSGTEARQLAATLYARYDDVNDLNPEVFKVRVKAKTVFANRVKGQK